MQESAKQDVYKSANYNICTVALVTPPPPSTPPPPRPTKEICHRYRKSAKKYMKKIIDMSLYVSVPPVGCTLTCEYLREFSKNFEMTLMLFSGAWGKMIHQRNLKQKISWHYPFKCTLYNTYGLQESRKDLCTSWNVSSEDGGWGGGGKHRQPIW